MDKNELSSRLREGQGADRELDMALCKHFGLIDANDQIAAHWAADWGRLTSSLDVVFALVGRELPNAHINWNMAPKMSEVIFLIGSDLEIKIGPILHPDRCRAFLLALLAATHKE